MTASASSILSRRKNARGLCFLLSVPCLISIFEFGVGPETDPFDFGFFSGASLPVLSLSFLRSIRRAAFFACFSLRADSFCRFSNVSFPINSRFQLSLLTLTGLQDSVSFGRIRPVSLISIIGKQVMSKTAEPDFLCTHEITGPNFL